MDNHHKEKIARTFTHFIRTIKKHDHSIYFWIQGGALRRCLDDTLVFGNEEHKKKWPWAIDIDIHTTTWKDHGKISQILIREMGFKLSNELGNNTFHNFFGVEVDLIKPYIPNNILKLPNNH